MRARTLPALVGALILILAAPASAVDVETIAKGLDNPRPGLWGVTASMYMSQLTGFPHPVGAANVYRVNSKTGEAEVFASGFTDIMDLAFGKDGTLWVLEIDHDGLFSVPPNSTDGAIHAVSADGTSEQLELEPGTLTHPGGITVGKDGALYVINRADEARTGEVLRIEVDDDGRECGPN